MMLSAWRASTICPTAVAAIPERSRIAVACAT